MKTSGLSPLSGGEAEGCLPGGDAVRVYGQEKSTPPWNRKKVEMMPSPAALKWKQDLDTVVVVLTPSDLHEDRLEATVAALTSLATDPGCRQMRLDFSAVEYVTSCFLGKLVALRNLLLNRDGRLALDNVGPLLYEILDITRLTTLFPVHRREAKSGPGHRASA